MQKLIEKLGQFAEERDWEQYHSPKNLAMALSVEVAELVEHFQWLTQAQSYELADEQRAEIKDEIGDILIYLTNLANKLGIDPIEAAHQKIEKNRLKYPPDTAAATASKYQDAICGIEFIRVRGGTFDMGDTLDQGTENELPVHQVELQDFYISRYPVTQAQWAVLLEENPSEFKHPDHPVVNVTWSDARDFARKLSDALHGEVQFMLPTEAQWEYAARSGGNNDLYAGGDDADAVAWFDENSQGTTHPVGKKRPTALGLCDMSGNVWEWCRDTYHPEAYGRHSRINPVTESKGPDRVIRGGSWNLDVWNTRCTRRFNFRADAYGPGLGFRLAMQTQ